MEVTERTEVVVTVSSRKHRSNQVLHKRVTRCPTTELLAAGIPMEHIRAVVRAVAVAEVARESGWPVDVAQLQVEVR